jgi:hypothetical protein
MMISEWFRNRWEARFHSCMGRFSYPSGEQTRVHSVMKPTTRMGSSTLSVVRSDAKLPESGAEVWKLRPM